MFELHFAPPAHALESLFMLHTRFVSLGSLASLASLALLTNCSPSADDSGAPPNGSGGSEVGAGGAATGSGGDGTIGGPSGGAGPQAGGAPGAGAGGSGVGGDVNSNAGGAPTGSGGAGTGSGGGTPGDGGAGGPDVDKEGKPNAAPGSMSSVPQDYLRIGDIRILNNNWGSEDLGCNTPMSVFVRQDSSFGWTFDRPSCGGQGSKPDFPQIEFGIHPFGIGNSLVTSPEFSSTTLLPKKLSEIQSASVTVENLNISLEAEESWNITFEFWISDVDPTQPTPQGRAHSAFAELMTFWGWQPGRWPKDGPGQNGAFEGGSVSGPDQVGSGGRNYTLWVQRDNWADGWRYYQFRDNSGPQKNFSGKLDVKPFIDYLLSRPGFNGDMWVTRLEVGSEIDDNTRGTVTMTGITFEVNGEARSQVIGAN